MNSALNGILLIARREFITRVRTRVFVIGTILIMVGIGGYLAFQILVLSKQESTVKENIAFVGAVNALQQPFISGAKTLGYVVTPKAASSVDDATNQLKTSKLDAVISGSETSPTVMVRSAFPGDLRALLQTLVQARALNQALIDAGVNPAVVDAQVAQAKVTVETIKGTNAQRIEEVVAGFVVAILLYVALLTYGTFIAQGVVEEKANRIVEILLSTVRPSQLLIGKVLGIGLVGLLQLSIIGVTAIVLASVTKVFTVPTVAVSLVFSGVLWFVLGFFLYAVLFAAAGSLVSRSEEVQSVVLPITMMAIISYFVAISVVTPMFSGSTMSSTGVLLAMIPLISPVLMPTGMATGDVAVWQVILAIVLTGLFSAGATWVAARIYSNSVLRLGARVKLRDALRGEARRIA